MKTQIITLDKLDKFLNVRDRKVISIVPHTYMKETSKGGTDTQILKSVLIFYQEI